MSPFVTHALDVKRAWVLFPEPKVNRNDPKAAESSFLATPTRWLEKQKSGCSTKTEAHLGRSRCTSVSKTFHVKSLGLKSSGLASFVLLFCSQIF